MNTHTASAYLVLKANRGYGFANQETGLKPVTEVNIATMRKGRPRNLDPDEIAVKVRVQVPDTAFDPLAPDALIVVPESMVQKGPVDVEVDDANEE